MLALTLAKSSSWTLDATVDDTTQAMTLGPLWWTQDRMPDRMPAPLLPRRRLSLQSHLEGSTPAGFVLMGG